MQRIIEHELPEMAARSRLMVGRLRDLDDRISLLQGRRQGAAVNDPTGDAALRELEERQRDWIEHETRVKALEEEQARAQSSLEAARIAAKAQRIEHFKEGRLRSRQDLTNRVLESLPALADRLQASKEERFGKYLSAALNELWNKTNRLTGVEVSFSARRIALIDAFGEISKPDLSSGEKQLFAIAFIYSLAKLSGRLMPFVIDTPLGRLDQQHRRRFIAEFLPNASHQIILLSTDTEIVGQLYERVRPLVAHHHELADYNDGATSRVTMVSA
jgi:DNA sulfur modification protein DndD